jgi:hypothetical protein
MGTRLSLRPLFHEAPKMHSFGRHPRREIAMSCPAPAASIENNYTRIGEPT